MHAIVLQAALHPDGRWAWETPLLQRLPYAKRLQLESRSNDARMCALAGIALALGGADRVTGAPIGVERLVFPLEGKPSFTAGPRFSISHTDGFVCCALTAAVEIGIDAESLPAAITAGTQQKLRRWTALEAALKASGRGLRHAREVRLSADLTTAELAGETYVLQPVDLDDSLMCHVAARRTLQISVVSVNLAAMEFSAAVQRSLGLGA